MISAIQAISLVGQHTKKRFMEQFKAVFLIVAYLILFQLLVLDIPILGATTIGLGLFLVVVGLMFFMEGLMIGLMPLGETIGVKLPQKSTTLTIIIFAFVLGIGATFAEPAISVLKSAGATVKAWEAPLLFLLLNKSADILVYSVGVGVGFAVSLGMLRFLYGWSLKPFIYILVSTLILLTIGGFWNENIAYLAGLAWDCGAVTTGPVTVPLVLALGIGISRVAGGSQSSGFGVVTLASACPIITVYLIGYIFLAMGGVPQPASQQDFFDKDNKSKWTQLFNDEAEFDQYQAKMTAKKVQGVPTKNENEESGFKVFTRNAMAALQAILPLTLLMILVLLFLLKSPLRRKDEISLGVGLAILGMTVFSIGIETGLSQIGSQVGSKLSSAFQTIQLKGSTMTLDNFDTKAVKQAVTPQGETEEFFFLKDGKSYDAVSFNSENYNAEEKRYTFIPTRGPLFGSGGFAGMGSGLAGIIVVLLFAFFMGLGATLAEPALNALGDSVEKITVGALKKTVLMNTVALGVGIGLSLGVAKIIWNIPLSHMLIPPYILLMIITYLSTEELVNIGWDSAGVTTGPITVPLVLAMGLGIGGQVDVVEGFGILSLASVCPIMAVLTVGLWVKYKNRKNQLTSSEDDSSAGQ